MCGGSWVPTCWRVRARLVRALGFEMIAGMYFDVTGMTWDDWTGSLPIAIFGTIEESLELTGIAVFLHALVRHLESLDVRFELSAAPEPQTDETVGTVDAPAEAISAPAQV